MGPAPEDAWREIDGSFVLMCAYKSVLVLPSVMVERYLMFDCNSVTHATYDDQFTPSVKPDDGTVDVCLLRAVRSVCFLVANFIYALVSRFDCLGVFLGLETGAHVKPPSVVEVYKTRAYSLVPRGRSLWDVR